MGEIDIKDVAGQNPDEKSRKEENAILLRVVNEFVPIYEEFFVRYPGQLRVSALFSILNSEIEIGITSEKNDPMISRFLDNTALALIDYGTKLRNRKGNIPHE